MKWNKLALIALAIGNIFTLQSCLTVEQQVQQLQPSNDHNDPHTYSNYSHNKTAHLNLDLNVDFASKTLVGFAEWTIEKLSKSSSEVIFDTYKLNIDSVFLDDSIKALFHIGKFDQILGAPLSVKLHPSTQKVKIHYHTTNDATALQWLDAKQTFEKKYPFLYTQGESIYTRSWIPCQDAPAVRFTYDATIRTPKELMAVMSATNATQKNNTGTYQFRMPHKIPAYLIALAVGDLKFQALNDKMGVYAEPTQLAKSAAELADLDKMMHAAEKLYGQYAWGRYDVLFLPIGFPFGGMENPRLTFATPTILTGDKSLVNLIAHELAHSWSGNLVTNATWNDFWLNESFTVYFERRIMEEVEGKEYAAMLWDIGLQDLHYSIEKYTKNNELQYSKLKLDLENQDPDLGLTDFAYEKGAAMLLLIENTIGRQALDTFIIEYFNANKFSSLFTADFDAYISKTLFKKYPQLRKEIKFDEWVYEAGLPDNCPTINNPRFEAVSQLAQVFIDSAKLSTEQTANWSTFEWLHFIRTIEPKINNTEPLAYLDQQFHLSKSTNAEIATQWFVLTIRQNYAPALPYIKNFLQHTGRMKFLEPIYEAMHQNSDSGKTLAQNLFNQYRNNYHPLAQKSVQQILTQ